MLFTVLNPYSDLSPFIGCGRHFWDIWLWPHSESTMRMFNLLKSRLVLEVMLLRPWDFPGKSPGVDCHFLLQGIFPTQESNPGLPHCGQMLYRLSHQGSPFTSLSLHPESTMRMFNLLKSRLVLQVIENPYFRSSWFLSFGSCCNALWNSLILSTSLCFSLLSLSVKSFMNSAYIQYITKPHNI